MRSPLRSRMPTETTDNAFGPRELCASVTRQHNDDAAASGIPGVDGNISVRSGERLPLTPRHLLEVLRRPDAGADVIRQRRRDERHPFTRA